MCLYFLVSCYCPHSRLRKAVGLGGVWGGGIDGPLVTFFTIAVPAVLLVAVTVTVMTSPAAIVIPEKSYA